MSRLDSLESWNTREARISASVNTARGQSYAWVGVAGNTEEAQIPASMDTKHEGMAPVSYLHSTVVAGSVSSSALPGHRSCTSDYERMCKGIQGKKRTVVAVHIQAQPLPMATRPLHSPDH